MKKNYFSFIFITFILVLPSDCRPKRGKGGYNSPHTVYDQKQTGDYNIQLHLKDFQIIALLGDDTSNFGDYDYTYDYSDFTIKPVSHKPTESSLSSSSSSTVSPSTIKQTTSFSSTRPSYQPYPIIHPSTEKPHKEIIKPENKPQSNENPPLNEKPITNNKTTNDKPPVNNKPIISEVPLNKPVLSEVPLNKPIISEAPLNKPVLSEVPLNKPIINEAPLNKPVLSEVPLNKPIISEVPLKQQDKPSTNLISSILNNSTITKTSKLDDLSSPGKIKVQIIETPVRMGIVPGEDIGEQSEGLPQGEILQIKRCAQGFTRDKRGRCRRVRKPSNTQQPFPYGFSRLASNLVSRLRQTSEENSASSSESKED